MNTDKCQYCGAPKCVHTPFWFECGTHEIGDQSEACKERVAHAETRKKLASAEKEVQEQMSIRLDEIEQTETLEKQLAETRKKLVQATGILSKLIPYLRHDDVCFSSRSDEPCDCRCGLREIIVEAGTAVNAAKEKGTK